MSVAKYISPGGAINNTHRNTEVQWVLRFIDPEEETESFFHLKTIKGMTACIKCYIVDIIWSNLSY